MDPATLSVAAVALLANGFGAGFAQEAGKNALDAIQAVGRAVTTRLSRHGDERIALAELKANPSDPVKRAAVAEYVRRDIEADGQFAASLAALVAAARSHDAGRSLIAQASGQAKQAAARLGDHQGIADYLRKALLEDAGRLSARTRSTFTAMLASIA